MLIYVSNVEYDPVDFYGQAYVTSFERVAFSTIVRVTFFNNMHAFFRNCCHHSGRYCSPRERVSSSKNILRVRR